MMLALCCITKLQSNSNVTLIDLLYVFTCVTFEASKYWEPLTPNSLGSPHCGLQLFSLLSMIHRLYNGDWHYHRNSVIFNIYLYIKPK